MQKLKNCLNDIHNFMFTNKLKLNPDKTEFILIGSPKNRKQLLPHFPINILGNQFSPAQSVRNLGVVFDSNFNFSNHMSQVIKSTRVHVRDLYRICPLLDLNTSVLLANALVISRWDYCNSLFLSLTDFQLRRLQLVDGRFGHGRFGLGRFGLGRFGHGRFGQAIFKGGRFGQIYIFRRFI